MKYVLDTNLYVAATRDRAAAEGMAEFLAAHLPETWFHATVGQELMVGCTSATARRQVREAYIRPFESRGRILLPSLGAWLRSGELVGRLVERKVLSPGGFSRSFLNDALLAASCREQGATLVTSNVRDFARLQTVERFEFVEPWP